MSSPQDRRDFLKASAVAGVAATTRLTGAFAAGNDTIKVGLIGCGSRGTRAVLDHLLAEQRINKGSPKTEVVAVGDVFRGQAERAVRVFKDPKSKDYGPFVKQIKVTPETTFDGLDAYQKVIGAGVDMVILATPPGFRPIHLEAAINANKHIFCEKPVCVDATGARKCFSLVPEVTKRNLSLVAGTQRRHQKGYIETVKKIHDKAIGEVIACRCAWNSGGPNPIWFRDRQASQTDAEYQINNWYHFLWVCGDHIVEQHVHNLDVCNWVMNDRPIKATGIGGRATRRSGDPNVVGQIWDHFAVEYEYKNGVRMFSYCRHIPASEPDVSETIFGTAGNSRVNRYEINRKRVADDMIDGESRDPYVQEHIDLLNSIRASKPLNELQSVTEATFTAVLGRNAAYAEKWLDWDEALAAGEDTMPKELRMNMKLPVTPAPVPGAWKLPAKA